MPYAVAAHVVVVIHVAFVAFVAFGGYLAWHRPRVLVAHVPALMWALGIVTIGWSCPLTGLENALRTRAGTAAYDGGFIDRYLTGVLYPTQYEWLAQAVLGAVVLVAYVGLARRQMARRSARRDPRAGRTASALGRSARPPQGGD